MNTFTKISHSDFRKIVILITAIFVFPFCSQSQYFFEEYFDANAQGFCPENVIQTPSGYLFHGIKETGSTPEFLTLETDLDGNQLSIQTFSLSDPSAQYQRLEDGNFIKQFITPDGTRVQKVTPTESVLWSVDVNSNNTFSPQLAAGILENSQGDIFVGYFTFSFPAEIFVSKINSVGTLLWTSTFDATQHNISNDGFINEMNMMVASDDSGVFVDFKADPSAFAFNRVVKLSSAGVYEFDNYSIVFPSSDRSVFEPGVNGNVFTRNIAGTVARSYSYTGNAIHTWNPNYSILEYTSFTSSLQEGIVTALEATADGGVLIGGIKTERIFDNPRQEMYLVKVDELGEVVFTNVNYPFVGHIKNIKEYPDGNIMLSGLRDGRPWMLLVNSDGNPSTQSCPEDIAGYTFEGSFRGHNYFLSDGNSNYVDALATASNNGGYIVSIEDIIENGRVGSFLPNNTSVYIGLNDLQNEGSPEWASGEDFIFDYTDDCVGCPMNTNENNVTTYNFWSPYKWSWESGGAYRPHLMERNCEENNAAIVNDLPNDLGYAGCIVNVASNLLQNKDRESEISTTAVETGLNSTNWWKAVDGDNNTFTESQVETNAEWNTTLFYDFWIDEIRIHPRSDGQFPLENIRVQIKQTNNIFVLDTLLAGPQTGNPLIIPCGKMGRWVTIIKEGMGVLSFSELEIMGCIKDVVDPIRFECPKDMVVNAGPSGTYVVDYNDEEFNLDCLGSGNGGYSLRGPQEGDVILPGDYLYEVDSGNDFCGYQYCNNILTVLPFNSGNGEITVTCPDELTVIAPDNTSGAVVNWNLPEATTTCTVGNNFTFDQQSGLPNGSVFPLGTYEISYAVSDDCGNIKNCTFTVNVETASNTSCPDSIAGYILLGTFENHKYYLSRNITNSPYPYTDNIITVGNWPTSAATAMANGGYLASINSAAENQFIYDKIGNTSVFIGISDLQNDGTYEWESEEPITYTNYDGNFPSSVAYGTMNFWSGTWTFDTGLAVRPHILEIDCGTPGGGILTVNCPADATVILPDGATETVVNFNAPVANSTCGIGNVNIVQLSGVNDGSILTEGIYTIEFQISDGCGNIQNCSFNISVEENTGGGGCPQDIAGFTVLGEYGDSKYFISDVPAQPTAAQMEAAANNGFLAVINDQGENDFILQNISEIVYIGLNDVQSEGNLVWENGDPLIYNNVNPCSFCSENADDLDYVIMAPWDGTWSFSSVWNGRKYVIEVPCDGGPGGGDEPDLTVSNLTNLPSSGNEGEVIFFNFDLNNIGTIAATGSYQINTYISTDNIFSNDDVLAGEVPTGDTPVGTIAAVPAAITVPNLPDGSYFLIVVADALNQITESNENNNTVFTSFEITSSGGGGCPTSLTDFSFLGEFNGSAYFLSDDVARPADAQIVASQIGGHLAVINSQAENDFLSPQINELVYLGINDFTTEGTLEWVNGDPVDFTNFDVCTFCNENSVDMDFVVMHSWDGAWSWSNFYNQRKYIVEIPCNTNMLNQNMQNLLIAQPSIQSISDNLSIQKIHPNPANDFIFITLENSKEQTVDIQIFDTRGSLLRFEKLNLYEGKSTNEISISELPAGVYSIYIPQIEGLGKSQRFVKIK